jgi:hypothetical protein
MIAEIDNNETLEDTGTIVEIEGEEVDQKEGGALRVEVLVVAALRRKERRERGANPLEANFQRVNLESLNNTIAHEYINHYHLYSSS